MRPIEMNLARRPFVNQQPVIRISVLLWVLGIALLALNVTLYYRHIEGTGEQQELLQAAERRLTEETATVERLRGELEELDLQQQNQQAAFLNSQIAQRVFSWSALFDRLAEVVPAEVQMGGISPRIVELDADSSRSRLTGPPVEMVKLDLRGTSRSPEAILEFIDALFAHPRFFEPDLTRESLAEGQENSFTLSVLYLPSPEASDEVLTEPVGMELEDRSQIGQEITEDTADRGLVVAEPTEGGE